jgi:hypothetical protein
MRFVRPDPLEGSVPLGGGLQHFALQLSPLTRRLAHFASLFAPSHEPHAQPWLFGAICCFVTSAAQNGSSG